MTVNIDELRDSAISAQQNPEYRSAERLEGLADGTIEALDHLETAIRENAALRERAEKAERQARCLAENLTESILAHALAPPSKITIDDLWSPDEWLERTKTGVVTL